MSIFEKAAAALAALKPSFESELESLVERHAREITEIEEKFRRKREEAAIELTRHDPAFIAQEAQANAAVLRSYTRNRRLLALRALADQFNAAHPKAFSEAEVTGLHGLYLLDGDAVAGFLMGGD